MTTGIVETGRRIAEENPAALENGGGNLGDRLGNMLDLEDTSPLSTLGSFLNTAMFFDVLGGGLDMLANAGEVMSAGNGDLLSGLNEGLADNFGANPNVRAQFGPDGAPAPAPAAAPPQTVAAAPNASTPPTAQVAMPGFSPPGA